MCAKLLQLCPPLCDPVGCSLPGSSVHRILQAGVLKWVAISFSRGSSQPRDWTHVSCLLHWQMSSLPLAPPAEKAMAPHSSTLAWTIPWMEEPGRLQSMGLLGVGHDWATSFTFHFHALEKEMATHSSVLAWRIPGMGEPGGLLSMGLHRVRHDWSNLVAAAAAAPEKPTVALVWDEWNGSTQDGKFNDV